MEQKHKNGYWINQLTDVQAVELLKYLTSVNDSRKLIKVPGLKRFEKSIMVCYTYERKSGYIRFVDSDLTIKDFEIKGIAQLNHFVQYMINIFGVEYAEDFIEYARNFIESNPEDKSCKKLFNEIKVVQDYIKQEQTTQNI